MKKFLFLTILFGFLQFNSAFAVNTLFGDTLVSNTGVQITVPIRVIDFQNIISVQGTLNFDTSVVKLDTVLQFGFPSMSIADFGLLNRANGELTYSWLDNSLQGPNLSDSSILFALRFNVVGALGSFSNISFSNIPTMLEVADSNFTVLPTVYFNGRVEVQAPILNTITTSSLQMTSYCQGSNLNVAFIATGTYGGSNVFMAQLSDASGSFASPVNIGVSPGPSPIMAQIPVGTPSGIGYRIRVVASTPLTIGTNNGVDFTIHALPNVTLANFTSVALNDPTFALSGGMPLGGSYSGPGVTFGMFDPTAAGLGTHTIVYSFTDVNGCNNTASNTITVNPPAGQSIFITSISKLTFCEGDSITVQFTANGTYNSNNTFFLQLSNASGSFATPFAIGSLPGRFSGTIATTIPPLIGGGTGYRVRVIAISPSVIGIDNGTNLTIHANPNVVVLPQPDVCLNTPIFPLTVGRPVGGTYSGTGITNGLFDASAAGLGVFNINYFYVDSNGCSGAALGNIRVNAAPNVSFNALNDVCENDADFPLSGGNPSGGTYSGNGVDASGNFQPSVAGAGTFILTYTYQDAAGCSNSANQTIRVNAKPSTPTISRVGVDLQSSSSSGNQWLFNHVSIAGATNQIYTPAQNGLHQVFVTNSNNCVSDTSLDFNVTWSSIEALEKSIGFKVYPNPSNSIFNLEFQLQHNSETTVRVLNTLGQIVFEQEVSQAENVQNIPIDLNGFAKGIYTLELVWDENSIQKSLILK